MYCYTKCSIKSCMCIVRIVGGTLEMLDVIFSENSLKIVGLFLVIFSENFSLTVNLVYSVIFSENLKNYACPTIILVKN